MNGANKKFIWNYICIAKNKSNMLPFKEIFVYESEVFLAILDY